MELQHRIDYIFNTLDFYLQVFTSEKWDALLQLAVDNPDIHDIYDECESSQTTFLNHMINKLEETNFSFRREARDRFIRLRNTIRKLADDQVTIILDLIQDIIRKLFELLKAESKYLLSKYYFNHLPSKVCSDHHHLILPDL